MAGPLTFSASREVQATRDAVWAVIGDFGNEHRWTKTLSSCSRDTPTVRVGTVRHCLLPEPLMGRKEVFETLIELHPGKSLGYTLDGTAGPFAQSAGRWTVAPAGPDRTIVTVEGRFLPRHFGVRLLWPLLGPMLGRMSRRIVGELETFVRQSRAEPGLDHSCAGNPS